MLNATNYKTRLKFLSQAKKPYKKVVISKIAMKKACIIADILTQKKIRIQNQFIINYKV